MIVVLDDQGNLGVAVTLKSMNEHDTQLIEGGQSEKRTL